MALRAVVVAAAAAMLLQLERRGENAV